jgi:hypothetical protein
VNPPNSLEDAMVYAPDHRKIVYSAHGNKTYLFDIDTETWTRVYPANQPTLNRMGHMMAYDSKRHLTMLFGGGQYPNPGRDLYALDLDSNKYTRKADCPVDSKADGFVYCPKYDLFMAVIDSNTYIYWPETDTWTQLVTPQKPHCIYQTMAYDMENDLFVVQGGNWQAAKWWVLRLDQATALQGGRMVPGSLHAAPALTVTPNPFHGAVVISIHDGHVGATRRVAPTLAIYNTHGRVVHRAHTAATHIWDASGFPAGAYIIRLNAGNEQYTARAIMLK